MKSQSVWLTHQDHRRPQVSRLPGAGVLLVLILAILGCAKQPSNLVLKVWTTESDPATLKVMEEIGDELVQSEPEIDEVEVVAVPWSDLSVKLQQGFQTGSLPGVTHLEPFFTKAFVDRDLLIPLDSLVQELGPQDIQEAVRDVAKFDGHYWGIPQHFGVSFMAYREDLLARMGVRVPGTWAEFRDASSKLGSGGLPTPVYFPGGDRFFIDAIFFEALASNGGHAYINGLPNFDSPEAVETLAYLKNLVATAPTETWPSATYVEGFPRMVRGEVGFNLFVGGRATKSFAEQWTDQEMAADRIFLPFEPPVGPHGSQGYSSVDCEPFVVINQAKNSGSSAEEGPALENASLAYLRLLYRKDNYLRLMKSVPIQLIPIFKSMAAQYSQTPFVQRWKPWYDQAISMVEARRVNPYFTTSSEDLEIPYLFDLYGSRVITNMVASVMAGDRSAKEAAKIAQRKALAIAEEY